MNRIFRSGLFLAALSIVASSCSKNSDAPIDPYHEGPHIEAPVSVALESSLLTYDAKLLEDPQPSGRSLNWDPRNSEVTYSIQGSSKDILDDNGQGTGNKSKIAKYNKTLTVTNHPSRDLLMIYNKAPFDPELTASTGTYYQGFDYFMQPSLRNLGFTVKLQF